MTAFVYLVRHGAADPHDGPLSEAGREQARHLGQRLAEVPLSAIYHGPLQRAADTAAIIAGYRPDVPLIESDLAGDYLPSDPDRAALPADYAAYLDGFDSAERAEGPGRAAAALELFTRASEPEVHRLIVTHNLLIGWIVSQAMAAPDWRWLGVNQMNCALTVIACQPGLPPSLLTFNDAGHLPPELRWTGFPPRLRPPA
jgi:probable phosphoglycerate mutase